MAATYDYVDADGQPRYQVCRYTFDDNGDKTFRQRHRDSSGLLQWNLKGIERLPYRLPDLLAASSSATVFVPEGEKDVDRLIDLGLIATCNSEGAEKFTPGIVAWFKDRNVVLIEDNDDAGRRHLPKTAAVLRPVVASLKSVTFRDKAEKYDVTDWLNDGHTVDELRQRVEALPEYTEGMAPYEMDSSATGGVSDERIITFHTALELAGEHGEEVKWVVKKWVAAESIAEVSGKIKAAGKTTFVTSMARSVLDGSAFLGEITSKRPVVYLTEQNTTSFLAALRRADLDGREDFHVLRWSDVIGIPWNQIAEAAVEKALELGALLIVDTLPQFASIPGDDENSAGAALEAMAPLQRGAGEGLAVIVIRHERKSGGDISDSGRGSSAFGGSVDTLITIRRGDGNSLSNVRIIETISRFDDVPPLLYVELEPEGYKALGTEGEIASQKARDFLLEAAPTSEGDAAATKVLTDGAPVGKTTAAKELACLFNEGILRRTGTGKKGDAYRYWRPEIDSSAYRELVVNESISDADSDPLERGSPGTPTALADETPSGPSIDSSATTTLYTDKSISGQEMLAEQPGLPIDEPDESEADKSPGRRF